MATARRLHYSYAEYLEALSVSDLRLEYLDGEIFAMAGGSPEHGILAARIIQWLGFRLPPECKVMTSDVKVRVLATGLATFPDVSVVCGELERAPGDTNAIVNPILLVEVLSPAMGQVLVITSMSPVPASSPASACSIRSCAAIGTYVPSAV